MSTSMRGNDTVGFYNSWLHQSCSLLISFDLAKIPETIAASTQQGQSKDARSCVVVQETRTWARTGTFYTDSLHAALWTWFARTAMREPGGTKHAGERAAQSNGKAQLAQCFCMGET